MHTTDHAVPAAPRSLADYSSQESLVLRLEGHTASAVMEELIRVLHLEARRGEVSHAGCKSLNSELLTGPVDVSALTAPVFVSGETRPRFALGRTGEPLFWRVSKLTPIEFVMLFVDSLPGSAEGRQVSAALARLNRDDDCLGALRTAQSTADMLAVLAQVRVLPHDVDAALSASPPQVDAKPVISLGALDRSSHGKRRWRGMRSVICRP